MIGRLPLALLSLFIAGSAMATSFDCQFERLASGPRKLGAWIDKNNWLAVENQRLTLQTPDLFMPAWRLVPPRKGPVEAVRARPIDDLPTVDPFDGSRRELGFLLDSRVYADGLVVLRNGRVVTERYRNGLAPDKPRLLLGATRPLLNLLGAMSLSQGKLVGDKSVIRYLPGLAQATGLRKVSIQRLLESDERFVWEVSDLEAWRRSGGWRMDSAESGVRTWLAQPGRWDQPLKLPEAPRFSASPDDDLLAWTLAESNGMPLAQLFCEQLFRRSNPEHAMLWVSDVSGNELADGLGLSLRDFAKLGHLLVEARSSRSRAKIPNWFIETLVAASGGRSASIKGLAKGSEQRYGFVHLGGAPNRVALVAEHGTSLYLDFDKRLVIALYATRPGASTPESRALLEQIWQAVDKALNAPGSG